jgi:hypothetical protein
MSQPNPKEQDQTRLSATRRRELRELGRQGEPHRSLRWLFWGQGGSSSSPASTLTSEREGHTRRRGQEGPSSSPASSRWLWATLVLPLWLASLACGPAKEDRCPKIDSGKDTSYCCEVLKNCCPKLEAEEKTKCEEAVQTGAASSCQAKYNELDSNEKC